MTLYQTELRSLPLETGKKIANPRLTARPKIKWAMGFLRMLRKELENIPDRGVWKVGPLAVARKAKESADGGTRTHTDFSTGS